ncbi:hypothetical protein PRZ48_010218 [Zasmidium cellare]|uniref:Uncharacterized protein n=1 Tax=Zasmidium cellare TaxID=395010 RepID=A0ABR0EDY4_ZASCE|nr:hypothetical protein PRZ48_010218 [Zasmidium cellare]
MDYSQFRPEDAARLRRQDERIQLLREQRELGQQILREMTERDAYEASLATVSQNTPDTETQARPIVRTGITLASPVSRGPQTGSSTHPAGADEANVTVASGSRRCSQKRRRVSRSRSLSSSDMEYRPRKQQSRTRKYPFFSIDERYASIVTTDDGVVELACQFCGGNYFRPYHGGWRFLSGVQGVQKHIHMSHPDEHERIKFTRQSPSGWVVQNCVRKVLTEEQKEDVRQGRYQVRQVKIRTLADVANGAGPEAA